MKRLAIAGVLVACGGKGGGTGGATTPAVERDAAAPEVEVSVCAPGGECVTPVPAACSFPRGTKFVVAARWPAQPRFGAAVECSGVACDVSAPRTEDKRLVFDVTTTTTGTLVMTVDFFGPADQQRALAPCAIVE